MSEAATAQIVVETKFGQLTWDFGPLTQNALSTLNDPEAGKAWVKEAADYLAPFFLGALAAAMISGGEDGRLIFLSLSKGLEEANQTTKDLLTPM